MRLAPAGGRLAGGSPYGDLRGAGRVRGAPGRIAAIALVVALHVGLVYALVTGLAQRTIEIVRPPVETRILPPDRPPVPVPPPPAPALAPPPPLFVPPPEVRIAPPPAPTPAPVVVTPVKPAAPSPPAAPAIAAPPVAAAPREPVRVQPRLDPGHACEPDYPAVSRRLGETGSLVVQVLVQPDGRADDVRLVQSSGFERLDRAAVGGIPSACRFLPATVDGKPVAQWFTFRFVWKIK